MKCPKCEYLAFESGDRCRNCGYEFSLTSPAPAFDLELDPAPSPGLRWISSASSATSRPTAPAICLFLHLRVSTPNSRPRQPGAFEAACPGLP